MSARGDYEVPPPPTRAEVHERMLALIENDEHREEVSDWAAQWVLAPDPGVEDKVVREAFLHLAGADLRDSPTTYLHSKTDFLAWLKELEDSLSIADPPRSWPKRIQVGIRSPPRMKQLGFPPFMANVTNAQNDALGQYADDAGIVPVSLQNYSRWKKLK